MIALSYSRLSCFEQCERKFEYLYVLKSVVDDGNEFTQYGTRVHTALEEYGRDGTPLPPESAQFKPIVDVVLKQSGDKLFEYKMAIKQDFSPCDWFDKEVWVRGIADVIVTRGKVAFVGDWKTGKVKDNPTQVKLFACMVMAHFPEVDTVRTAFIWLGHDEVTDDKFHRQYLDEMWATLTPRFAAVQEAVDIGVFKSKPSGLCNWCPAKARCPDKKR